ncbi:MAG: tRNA (5-methylaminomethyl-2-thiouridine)(34)-methyltransferase MnmD [Maricaulaceae bacterium]
MPPPLPLTAAPTPDLDWSRQDTPVATGFDDIYFSTDGGIEETQTVFLKGCDLPTRWENGEDHTIGELGFGSGLNLLVAWQAFEAILKADQHLDFISIEKFPFTTDMLRRALSHWPDLKPFSDRLITLWPGPVKGVHRLNLSPQVSLTLYIDDVGPALDQMSQPVDSWFLDGFSPAKNPAMWSPEIMQKLARLSHSETRLATFTVAGDVRRALTEARFDVEKVEGFGRKRHRLEARFPNGPSKPNPTRLTPLIIGGGIGGASLVKAFAARGHNAKLIHDDPQMQRAASGNPAAMIKPRLDLQDRPESRFFLAAYLHALRAYEDGGKILSRGILQFAKDEKEQARFEKILSQAPLPTDHMQAHAKGLNFPKALVIDPVKTVTAWREPAETMTAQVTKLTQIDGMWHALGADGQSLDQSKLMIVASGAGVKTIELEDQGTLADILALRFSRGQLTWANGPLEQATAYGGYAVNIDGDILLGATHDRLDGRDPYALRNEDDAHNLTMAKAFLGDGFKLSERKGRASLRVTTANTLPKVVEVAPRLWVMTGLGSRGFVFAPLRAEQIAAHLCGQPVAVAQEV